MRPTTYGALVVIVLSACKPASRVSDATLRSPEARARGKALFQEHCALCHGEHADGHGARREALTGKPADFTSRDWRRTATPDGVYSVIHDGKPGTSMGAWRSLSDRDVADLTAYVLSVQEVGP